MGKYHFCGCVPGRRGLCEIWCSGASTPYTLSHVLVIQGNCRASGSEGAVGPSTAPKMEQMWEVEGQGSAGLS